MKIFDIAMEEVEDKLTPAINEVPVCIIGEMRDSSEIEENVQELNTLDTILQETEADAVTLEQIATVLRSGGLSPAGDRIASIAVESISKRLGIARKVSLESSSVNGLKIATETLGSLVTRIWESLRKLTSMVLDKIVEFSGKLMKYVTKTLKSLVKFVIEYNQGVYIVNGKRCVLKEREVSIAGWDDKKSAVDNAKQYMEFVYAVRSLARDYSNETREICKEMTELVKALVQSNGEVNDRVKRIIQSISDIETNQLILSQKETEVINKCPYGFKFEGHETTSPNGSAGILSTHFIVKDQPDGIFKTPKNVNQINTANHMISCLEADIEGTCTAHEDVVKSIKAKVETTGHSLGQDIQKISGFDGGSNAIADSHIRQVGNANLRKVLNTFGWMIQAMKHLTTSATAYRMMLNRSFVPEGDESLSMADRMAINSHSRYARGY